MRLLALALCLLAAARTVAAQGPTPLDRARAAFAAEGQVAYGGLRVADAEAFVLYPGPFRYDAEERFEALLLPDHGAALRGTAALRYVWDHGVRDPDILARAAALFVAGSQQVASENARERENLENHERITLPALRGTHLTFWVIRGGMRQTAEPAGVDFGALGDH